MKKIFLSIFLCVILLGANSNAQDLSQQLSKLGKDAAFSYTSPLLSGFASDLNSATFYSADLHSVLGFDIGVRFGASKALEEEKTFQFKTPATYTIQIASGITRTLTAGVDYPSTVTANTAVGSKDLTTIKTYRTLNTGNQEIELLKLPGGFDFSSVSLFAPQVDLGLPFGFEVMGRFLPTIKAGDFGKVNFWGFGIRHSIDQYIPLCPVDIAVHFMTQKLNLKDSSGNNLVTGTATAYGAEVSKSLAILTLFGGFQLEKGSFTVGPYSYLDNSTGTEVSVNIPEFTVDGKNKSRFILGARVVLAVINIHAEYSFAKTNVLGAGVGITFR